MLKIVFSLIVLLFLCAFIQPGETATYDFRIERFEITAGNPPVTLFDEFDNNDLSPDWYEEDYTAYESGGFAHLSSPGEFMEPLVLKKFVIIEERSSIATTDSSQFNAGIGTDFTATSTWKPQQLSENQFYGMQMYRFDSDSDINFNVINVSETLADILGTQPGLKIWFFKENTTQNWWHSIDENDIIGDVLLRLSFEDENNLVAASFSLDGGSSWQAPFESINFSPSVFYWMLEVANLNIYAGGDINKVTLLSPNGGEIIQSGSIHNIKWIATPEAESFKLQFSLNNGTDWVTIAKGIGGTNYDWQVPTPTKNKNKCN